MPTPRDPARRPAAALRTAGAAALVASLALVGAGCKKKAAPPPPAPAPAPAPAPTITPKKEEPPKPLTDAQKQQLEKDFQAARKVAAEARNLKAQGDLIQREKGIEAANDTYVQAKKLYQQAVRDTERWVEPMLGVVTEKQVAREPTLLTYIEERGRWLKEQSDMGKLHAK
jgi:Spy/CpxP family protein refolding chaperone